MTSRPRLSVYIDGFNLYYGALKKRPGAKWLDVGAWASRMFPDHDLLEVHYCTAVVSNQGDPGAILRQDRYFKALEAHVSRLTFHYGQFSVREKRMWRGPGPHACDCCTGSTAPCYCCSANTVNVIKTEEKGSDVNLAVLMLQDALLAKVDSALVVSGDSDLQLAVDLARRAGVNVFIADPRNGNSLKGTGRRKVRLAALEESQLPDVVTDAQGNTFTRNVEWN